MFFMCTHQPGKLDFPDSITSSDGALGDFFGRQVQRPGYVGDDATGFDLHDVQYLFACTPQAGSHNHVHVGNIFVGLRT